jgi:N-acetylglucosaminyl-diphospho-decaprenol L-rhamnosyltransferase
MTGRWAVSVVSHGHGAAVCRVLGDVHRQLAPAAHHLLLTLNAGEDSDFVKHLPPSLRACLTVIRNERPRGFGANHNAALRGVEADYVLVADPDLGLPGMTLENIEQALRQHDPAIVAPLACTPTGEAEDNGRALPTPSRVLRRALFGRGIDCGVPGRGAVAVDWLAGLCMAMRTDTFRLLGGFDERYFMYCEDVDLCLRARVHGIAVLLLSDLQVVHPARRASARRMRHLGWHLESLLRLWRSPAYRALNTARAQPPSGTTST